MKKIYSAHVYQGDTVLCRQASNLDCTDSRANEGSVGIAASVIVILNNVTRDLEGISARLQRGHITRQFR